MGSLVWRGEGGDEGTSATGSDSGGDSSGADSDSERQIDEDDIEDEEEEGKASPTKSVGHRRGGDSGGIRAELEGIRAHLGLSFTFFLSTSLCFFLAICFFLLLFSHNHTHVQALLIQSRLL